MVLKILKNQRTFQRSTSFLGQFFHENHLFFDAFEIVIKTNGFSILIFFQNIEIIENWKYSKIWNWHFLKNSNNCPILIHIMFISNYLKMGTRFYHGTTLGLPNS
jgi:hypothetical protein